MLHPAPQEWGCISAARLPGSAAASRGGLADWRHERPKNDMLRRRKICIWRWSVAGTKRPHGCFLHGGRSDWSPPCVRFFFVTSVLLFSSSISLAEAADPVRLAETAGFLLGNAHRCGVPTVRVEHAGRVIQYDRRRFLRSGRGSCGRRAPFPTKMAMF